MSAGDLAAAARGVKLPRTRRAPWWQYVRAFFWLVTGHRRVWGPLGKWGKPDPFRAYDAANPEPAAASSTDWVAPK